MSSQNPRIMRRSALKTAAAFAAASGLPLPGWYYEENAALALPQEPKSPNDKPGILLIGCGGQGRGDAKKAATFGRVIAVCDVDSKHAADAAVEHDGVATFSDFRKAIAQPGVDVVVNGTPDHWHTLVNIHAMRSGKDVYSEKPLTLTIGEGKKLVEVAKQTNRVLQTGSQQRSDERFRLACELVRNGRIGKLKHILTMLPSGPIQGPFKTADVPSEIDWDF